MEILERRKNNVVLLEVKGRLDSNTCARLEAEIDNGFNLLATKKLVLDFSGVEYISSAALRVLLSAQKKKPADCDFIIKSPSEFCKYVFDGTGADIFLNIEP